MIGITMPFLSPQLLAESCYPRVAVVHSADRERVTAAWERALAGTPLDIECRIVRGDGAIRWVNHRGRIVRDQKNGTDRFDGLVRDITDAMHDRPRLTRLAAKD